VAESATTAILVVTLFMQVFASQMIKYIWPLFNTVQLLLAFYFLAVNLPTNVDLVLKTLQGIIDLEALPREEIKEYFLDNKAAEYLMGLEPIMLFVVVALPFMLVLCGIALTVGYCLNQGKCNSCRTCMTKLVTKVKEKLFFSVPLRILIIGYLKVCIMSKPSSWFIQE
jgi:hypothetical protein